MTRGATGVSTSLVAFLCCYVELCVGMDYTPLEGDAMYEFSWAGSSSAARAEDVAFRTTITEESDRVTRLLANELLAPGFTDEVVEMATAQQEKYTCVLPKSATAEFEEEEELESKYLTPESLLQPLQFQCLELSQGYWSYELCHGQILRQYHEENTGKGIKMDEYILGKAKKSSLGDTNSEEKEEREDGEEEGEKRKIPTWHFNGFDYPYHKVDMTGGTPCDLRGNNPRSVSILYICQTDAQTYGSLLLVQESTACHYVAIVGSKQLCQNKDYRLKEQPVYTISCYSQGSSPKKPGILREQEFDIITMTTKTPTVSDTPKTVSKGGTPGSKVSSSGPSLDEAIILTFLTGEMCLRGGSGWWIHELCLKKQVKQIHQEVDNSETEVLLGVWNEDDHMEWYEREGQKKHTASSVTHLYNGGDVCDITGKPRVCYVKFKCSRKGKSPSQISLYLTEQSVCVYTLTVEGQFICPLLETLDDHGLFQVQHTASSSLFNEGLPLDDPRSDETHDSESETGTESGQEEDSVISKDSDQVEWEPEQMEWESDQVERESDSDTDNPHSRQKKV